MSHVLRLRSMGITLLLILSLVVGLLPLNAQEARDSQTIIGQLQAAPNEAAAQQVISGLSDAEQQALFADMDSGYTLSYSTPVRAVDGAAGCWYALRGRQRFTGGGALMYRYYLELEWCGDGLFITDWTATWTAEPILASVGFVRTTAFTVKGGVNRRSVTSYARGRFCVYNGNGRCVKQYNPWAQIQGYGNGNFRWGGGG